mmetsp:Transcript_25423/g.60101  ORF Transcript_25423/g.60101 Transcript_25423/m.60101 type:complete len:1022 (-) Transcript_25423:741-3806(-)
MTRQRQRQRRRIRSSSSLRLFFVGFLFLVWFRIDSLPVVVVIGWTSSTSSWSSSPNSLLRRRSRGIRIRFIERRDPLFHFVGIHRDLGSFRSCAPLVAEARSSEPPERLDEFPPSKEEQADDKINTWPDDEYLSSHYSGEITIESFNMDLQQIAMENPLRAQSILERVEDDERYQHFGIVPNSASYHCVIDGWCHHQNSKQKFTTLKTFPSSISAPISDSKRSEEGDKDETFDDVQFTTTNPAFAAELLLDRMEEEKTNSLTANPLSYIEVCEKWATIRPSSATNMERAESILDRYVKQMIQSTKEDKQQQQQQPPNQQQRRQENIHSLPTRNRQQNHTAPATHFHHPMYQPGNLVRMYCIVIEGWCRLIERVPEAMDRIEELLQEIESNDRLACRRDRFERLNPAPEATISEKDISVIQIRPNVVVYTTIITAISRTTKLSNIAQSADALLQRMKDYDIQPDLVAYTAVLSCWSRTTSKVERNMSSKRTMDLINEIENSYLQRRLAKPIPILYGTAIMAIARSFDRKAPVIAEDLLRRMYNNTASGRIAVQPTTSCWNAVIYAMGSNGKAEQAEALLFEMIERSRRDGEKVAPNIKTWGNVIRAYAQSGRSDAGVQANRIFEKLEAEYQKCWSNDDDDYESGDDCIKPNFVCYTTVLQAWARGRAPQNVTIQKVNNILHKMETAFEQTGDESIRPNGVTYTIAMNAYCRHDPMNCGALAQNLVDRMVRLYGKGVGFDRPSLVVMNTLINSWSASQDPAGPENAESIFRWMESQYASGDESMKPDEVTLCNVLNAYANNAQNGGAARAQDIMDYIESTSSTSLNGHGAELLTIQAYNVLIKAWGRSCTPESVGRADEILRQLEHRSEKGEDRLKPDITTYSSVINSAAYYSGGNAGKQNALQVALRAYRRIMSQSNELEANSIVFGTMFKAIGKLTVVGSRRDELIRDVFVECCELGYVDAFVLSKLRSCSSMSQYRTLVLDRCKKRSDQKKHGENINQTSYLSMKRVLASMPSSWVRNIA